MAEMLQPNYHMFYIILNSLQERTALIECLRQESMLAVFHYVPLHASPVGEKLGYRVGDFPVTEDISDRLLRLPFYYELSDDDINSVVSVIADFFKD